MHMHGYSNSGNTEYWQRARVGENEEESYEQDMGRIDE